ncbi:MAG: C39 family peptidase [Agathobacter sp.]|nr:C39 family peptidase [Agathobacter sp.]
MKKTEKIILIVFLLVGMVLPSSYYAGDTDEKKIETLEVECGTNSVDGTYVYQMVNALNKYNIYGRVYQSKLGSSFSSIYSFKDCIATSLTCGKPVVLHARTQYLDYYNGKSYGHYLSLDVYDRRTDDVRIVDCNYMEEYYGIHTVSVEEAYNCISASGRYLIY